MEKTGREYICPNCAKKKTESGEGIDKKPEDKEKMGEKKKTSNEANKDHKKKRMIRIFKVSYSSYRKQYTGVIKAKLFTYKVIE